MRDRQTAIRNADYMAQIKDFSGLWFGSILPTDIDAFMDFQDRLFVFVELKHGDAVMARGQELALERLCDACTTSTRESCLIIGRHQAGLGEQIDVSEAIVSDVRWHGSWYQWQERGETVRDVIEHVREKALLGVCRGK